MNLGGPDQHGVMVQVIRRFRSSPAGSTTSRSTGWVVSLPLTRKLPREELVDYAEEARAREFHSEWTAIRTAALRLISAPAIACHCSCLCTRVNGPARHGRGADGS